MSEDQQTFNNGKIALLNAGAQYLQLIHRVIEEHGADVDILDIDTPAECLAFYKGIVVSGGPRSVTEPSAPECDTGIYNLGVPILGICYGLQRMTKDLGGTVDKTQGKEYGEIEMEVLEGIPLFEGLDGAVQRVLMSHSDSARELAPGFEVVAHTTNLLTGEKIPAAIYNKERNFYGVQFHPEVEITEQGEQMLNNFIDICGIERKLRPVVEVGEIYTDWDAEIESKIELIRREAKGKLVVGGASGGVDSSVAMELTRRASLEQDQIFFHIDTGLNRKGESEAVVETYREHGFDVTLVDASEDIFTARAEAKYDLMNGAQRIRKGELGPPLRECIHPELKRWSFQAGYAPQFDKVVEAILEKKGLTKKDVKALQGTLYTDDVESGKIAKATAVIKSHHNCGLDLDEIKPNAQWLKDQVRIVAKILGLPDSIVNRQPFPGPGLLIRTVCTDGEDMNRMTEHQLKAYKQLDLKVRDIGAHFGMGARLTPVKTVGVAGDERDYSYLALLQPRKSWMDMEPEDWLLAKRTANAIPMFAYSQVNGFSEGVNRVALSFRNDIAGLETMLTPTFVTPETISKLQEADAIVRGLTREMGLDRQIAQFPVSMYPLGFDLCGGCTIDLRPIITKDFMTGRPAMPFNQIPSEFLIDVVAQLMALPFVANVTYELTSKPKSTTEKE